ncbi:hypothetical protein PQR71_18275 [Paraburkholderia fungorum]|jgi:hypothetical protein|uniref:hypothetical protein n=1 Tax=Paraburkholderia fungorum TaxID=134537 RepID=UPI0038BD7FDA
MKESKIYAPFIVRAEVRPGGDIFLRSEDAQQFVAASQSSGMAVLGIEAVRIDANQVMSYVDAIADYSPRSAMQWEACQERCNRLALDFLREVVEQKGDDTYFCFEAWIARNMPIT